MKKITVVGSGYVGMANAVMLAKHNDVTVLDIDPVRVDKNNNKKGTTTKQKLVYWELVTTTHGAVGRFSSSQACYSQQ